MDICMSKFMDIVQFQKGTPRLTKRGILSIIFHLILFHCVYCCLCMLYVNLLACSGVLADVITSWKPVWIALE